MAPRGQQRRALVGGHSGRRVREWTRGLSRDVDDLIDAIAATVLAIETFACGLDSVRGYLSGARDLALTAGLPITCDTVNEPPAPVLGSIFAGVPAVDMYAECAARVQHARELEYQVQRDVVSALSNLVQTPFLLTWLRRAGVLPPDNLGSTGVGLWAGGMGAAVLGGFADWGVKRGFGTFAPRNALGRYISPGSLTRSERFMEALSKSSWQARPNQAIAWARTANAGKLLGYAGAGLSGGMAALDRWHADAGDSSLTTSDRVTRAASVGVGAGVGAWGGAWAGAQVGGAIGTALGGPVGTVVGGAVGGFIGGFAGSEVGGEIGSAVSGIASQAVSSIGAVIPDGLGSTVSDFGDAVSFWN